MTTVPPCSGSARAWDTSGGQPVCAGCRLGAEALGVPAPPTRGGRPLGVVPPHASSVAVTVTRPRLTHPQTPTRPRGAAAMLAEAGDAQRRLVAAEQVTAEIRAERDRLVAELAAPVPGAVPYTYADIAAALGLTAQAVGKIAKAAGTARRTRGGGQAGPARLKGTPR